MLSRCPAEQGRLQKDAFSASRSRWPLHAERVGGTAGGDHLLQVCSTDTPSGQGTKSWAPLHLGSSLLPAGTVASQLCQKKATGRLWLRAKAVCQLTKIKDDSSANCTRQINKMFYINSPPCSHELFKLIYYLSDKAAQLKSIFIASCT